MDGPTVSLQDSYQGHQLGLLFLIVGRKPLAKEGGQRLTGEGVTYSLPAIPIILLRAEPLSNCYGVKPHACTDAEARDTSCLRLLENRNARN